MDSAGGRLSQFIVIGENIHATRVVLRRSKRFVADDGREAIRYAAIDGAPRLLSIPEAIKRTHDYDEGRVKHVKIAVQAAMAGGAAAEEGLAYIHRLVHDQAAAGAHFLDLNVDEISIRAEDQRQAMAWLVGVVQRLSELPLSVDSSSVEVIRVGLEAAATSGARALLNSASLERQDALDLAVAHDARVVLTAAGQSGMPDGATERVDNAARMIELARAKGIAVADMFVDPLIFPASVDPAFGGHSLDAIRQLRRTYGPEIHITGGMSNVSFGIPARRIINDVFLILAVEAGADSGIIDPVQNRPEDVFRIDRNSATYRLAEDVLLGRDPDCRNYLRAWRKKQLNSLRPSV